MFDWLPLNNTPLVLSIVATAVFILSAWMSIGRKRKVSWLKAVGFLVLATWTAGHYLDTTDSLFLTGALFLAMAAAFEQVAQAYAKQPKLATEAKKKKVAEILDGPNEADEELLLTAETAEAVKSQLSRSKRPVKLEGGVLTKPLVKLPAQRRRRVRSAVNVLIGFAVLLLVGWGSYKLTQKALQSKDDFDFLPTETENVVATVSPSPSVTAEPTASPTPVPVPEESAKPMVTIKETETGYLNVREGASTATVVLKKINPGETYELLEESEDGSWVKLQIDEATAGWVSAKYIEKNN